MGSDSFRQFCWGANIDGDNAPYRLSGRFLEWRDNMASNFVTKRITLTGCDVLKCCGLVLRVSFVHTSEILCFRQFRTVSDSFGRLEPESKYETSWDNENIIIFGDSKTSMDIMFASSLRDRRSGDLMAAF